MSWRDKILAAAAAVTGRPRRDVIVGSGPYELLSGVDALRRLGFDVKESPFMPPGQMLIMPAWSDDGSLSSAGLYRTVDPWGDRGKFTRRLENELAFRDQMTPEPDGWRLEERLAWDDVRRDLAAEADRQRELALKAVGEIIDDLYATTTVDGEPIEDPTAWRSRRAWERDYRQQQLMWATEARLSMSILRPEQFVTFTGA